MNNILKIYLKLFIQLLAFVALGYYFYILWQIPVPCVDPIPYNLGTFDSKFNVSKEYFLEALAEAEKIWEEPYGKDLFVYDAKYEEQDVLKVNLIHDYRQEATSKLDSLGVVVENTQASYDSLEVKFKALKARYDREQPVLDARIIAFNQKIKNYEAEVESWNQKGGAPEKEYEELEARRIVLDLELKEINREEKRLQNMVDEINAMVVALNRLADNLNLTVDKYNATNVARGETFEEGLYTSDGENQKIDIFEFSNREKLVRVLAHELGHALGIDHVQDTTAIMYEINKADTLTLSEADLDALKTVCDSGL